MLVSQIMNSFSCGEISTPAATQNKKGSTRGNHGSINISNFQGNNSSIIEGELVPLPAVEGCKYKRCNKGAV